MKPTKERVMEQTCDGCGKSLGSGMYIRKVTIEIDPKHTIVVCKSKTYSGDHNIPVTSCVSKATAKIKACPGCGEDWPHYGVCGECKAALGRGKDIGQPMETISLIHDKFFPHFYEHELVDQFRDALVEAVVGPRCRVAEWRDGYNARRVPRPQGGDIDSFHSGHRVVEIAKTQADGLERLAKIVYEIVDRLRREGRKEGRSLLVGLARGEYTIDEFEERQKRLVGEEGDD